MRSLVVTVRHAGVPLSSEPAADTSTNGRRSLVRAYQKKARASGVGHESLVAPICVVDLNDTFCPPVTIMSGVGIPPPSASEQRAEFETPAANEVGKNTLEVFLFRAASEAGAYYDNIIGIMNDSTSLPLKEGVKMIREQVPPLLAKAIALYPTAIAKVAAAEPKTQTGKSVKSITLEVVRKELAEPRLLQRELTTNSTTYGPASHFEDAVERNRKKIEREFKALLQQIPAAERVQLNQALS